MAINRSFSDYIKRRFDNNFWTIAEEVLRDNADYVEGLSFKLGWSSTKYLPIMEK